MTVPPVPPVRPVRPVPLARPAPSVTAGETGWRVVVLTGLVPVAESLLPRLRELGHEPVGWLWPGRPAKSTSKAWGAIGERMADTDIALRHAPDRRAAAPALRLLAPDVMLCWGCPWKLPQAALDVARLRSVNQHFARLPRHRGPHPLAWALREGDGEFGVTWHAMDADLDTGPILAQRQVPIDDADCTIEEVWPKLERAALDLLPRVFARIAAGDPGDPQPAAGASWAGPFAADYAHVDWTLPARAIHDQVRAWRLTFTPMPVNGPIAEVDGERVRLLRTSLTDPRNGGRPVPCGDGTLWIVESEPA
jgi:methionyl-tRNA formyltransferase